MKKLNLIIGKKQIVIVALLVTLSVAAFLNWQFATGDQAVTVMDLSNQNEKKETAQNYGEAELVNKNESTKNESTNEYIKKAILEKQRSYDETIEQNNKLINSENIPDEDRKKIIDQNLNLANKYEKEKSIEDQIKSKNLAKGSVTYIENGNVNTLVDSKQLNEQEVAQIADIINKTTGIESSKITITPVSN